MATLDGSDTDLAYLVATFSESMQNAISQLGLARVLIAMALHFVIPNNWPQVQGAYMTALLDFWYGQGSNGTRVAGGVQDDGENLGRALTLLVSDVVIRDTQVILDQAQAIQAATGGLEGGGSRSISDLNRTLQQLSETLFSMSSTISGDLSQLPMRCVAAHVIAGDPQSGPADIQNPPGLYVDAKSLLEFARVCISVASQASSGEEMQSALTSLNDSRDALSALSGVPILREAGLNLFQTLDDLRSRLDTLRDCYVTGLTIMAISAEKASDMFPGTDARFAALITDLKGML